ncbi:hypothetical protein [Paenibacillus borealis]|nr:hypothetical protein [Paenibacillus borealis]
MIEEAMRGKVEAVRREEWGERSGERGERREEWTECNEVCSVASMGGNRRFGRPMRTQMTLFGEKDCFFARCGLRGSYIVVWSSK